jgi:hypothetical protein
MRMLWKVAVLLPAAAVIGLLAEAKAEDGASGSSALPINNMTKEQFEALSPNATIVVRGESLTKQEFLARNSSAADAMNKKAEDARAQAKARFEAKRKAFLDGEQAKLDDANKQVETAAKKLLDQATAGRPPDYDSRIQQGAVLLERAKTARPDEAAEIESQASDLLKVLDPEATMNLAK